MSVWNVDAGNIKFGDSFDNDLLFRTPAIDDFLVHKRESIFFVTATKGLGKTFVLKAKSIAFIKAGIPLLHANVLVDKPGAGDVIFNKEKISFFSTVENWTNLWVMSIYMACVKRLNLVKEIEGFSAQYSAVFGKVLLSPADNITSFFKIILNLDQSEYFEIIKDMNNVLSPFMERVHTPLAAFIDNIDEYFEKHLKELSERKRSAEGEISSDMWHLSQKGLVEAIYQIASKNPHLKIFASIRKEVFIDILNDDTRGVQYKGESVELKYSKEQIKDIFILNIKKEARERLVYPEVLLKNPIYSFLGIDNVMSRYVHGETEDMFDYIYRHTLQRPRDLMLIGHQVSLVPVRDRTIEVIKDLVNKASTEIVKTYLKEVKPHMPYVDYDKLFNLIHTNIIPKRNLKEICSKYNNSSCKNIKCNDCGNTHVFCGLFSVGLLGYVDNDLINKHKIDNFLPPGMQSFDFRGKLPNSSHYLIHPGLYFIINDINHKFEPNKYNIVAPGYKFNDSFGVRAKKKKGDADKSSNLSIVKQKPFHVHFGAGKLGLGLVVPIFLKNSKVIIIQRPSSDWKKFEKRDVLWLKINNINIERFNIIYDSDSNYKISWIESELNKNVNFIIISNNESLIKSILNYADSVSTAVKTGLQNIISYFNGVNLIKSIDLYPFENDKNSVMLLKDSMRVICPKINVVPLMADKICAERIIGDDCLAIICERYQMVYIDGASQLSNNALNGVSDIHVFRDSKIYEYYHKRKYYIVNGLHMIIAIYAYMYISNKKIPIKDWGSYHLNILIENKELSTCFNAFLKMQAIRIILEMNGDIDIIYNAHETQSLQDIYNNILVYGQNTLDRFKTLPDNMLRVLDIHNISREEGKYKERIQLLNHFMIENARDIKALPINLGISYDEILSLISDLRGKTADLFLEIIIKQDDTTSKS